MRKELELKMANRWGRAGSISTAILAERSYVSCSPTEMAGSTWYGGYVSRSNRSLTKARHLRFAKSKRRWASCVSTLWAPAPMKWSDSLTSPARSLFIPAKSVANRVRGMATDGRANAGSRLGASSIFVLMARFFEAYCGRWPHQAPTYLLRGSVCQVVAIL